MRDAVDLMDMTVNIDGKAGKIAGFWITDLNVIYVKVLSKDKTYCNHPLEKIKDVIVKNPKT